MEKMIYIYQDYIHNSGVLFRRLGETFGEENVRHCDSHDILSGCLDPRRVALFVMPGGADLYYCEKLNGAGNAAIRRYVEEGGAYLGICAGAYYACRRIEWAQDEQHQAIIGERELGFFAGTAIGPVYSFLEDQNLSKSWDNCARLGTRFGESVAYYSAGPVFIPDEDSHHETLASYLDIDGQPAALVSIAVGKGRALLSSCHIEHTPDFLRMSRYLHRNLSREWTDAVYKAFSESWTTHSDIWDRYVPGLIKPSLKIAA